MGEWGREGQFLAGLEGNVVAIGPVIVSSNADFLRVFCVLHEQENISASPRAPPSGTPQCQDRIQNFRNWRGASFKSHRSKW
jgi:hypothetical protein